MRFAYFLLMTQFVTGDATAERRTQSTVVSCKPSLGGTLHRGIAEQTCIEWRPVDAAVVSSNVANGIPLTVVAASVQQNRFADVCVVKMHNRGSKCDQYPQPRVRDGLATPWGATCSGSRDNGIGLSRVSLTNQERGWVAGVEPRAVWECDNRVPIFENEGGWGATSKCNRTDRSSSGVLLGNSNRSCPDLTMARKGIISVQVNLSGKKTAGGVLNETKTHHIVASERTPRRQSKIKKGVFNNSACAKSCSHSAIGGLLGAMGHSETAVLQSAPECDLEHADEDISSSRTFSGVRRKNSAEQCDEGEVARALSSRPLSAQQKKAGWIV